MAVQAQKPGPPGPPGPEGPAGPQGPPGASGSESTYHHVQTVPAIVWSIAHNLGKYPTVDPIIDSAGALWESLDVEYVDLNNCNVICPALMSGEAWCN